MSKKKQSRSPFNLSRRNILLGTGTMAAGMLLGGNPEKATAEEKSAKPLKGRIKHSVCNWCFQPMKIETLAREAVRLGMRSVELVDPKHWLVLKKHGLICACTSSHGFRVGFANKKHHEICLDKLRTRIEQTSDAGFPNVITFSGFSKGVSRDEGIKNSVEGLKKIVGFAEQKKVTLCYEMLNTRVDIKMKGHPGYAADDIEYVIEVCRRVGSPNLKLLFDIYHVQIMQGDVITRINQYHEYIGHYHTAGNPGRAEIGDHQEINYPGIMRAIVKTKYTGYVGQEFIPTGKDKIAALSDAVRLCDV